MSQVSYQDEEITEKPLNAKLLWRLIGYLKPYLWWVSLAFILIVGTAFFRQATPYLTKIAIDDYILIGNL
ncbi:MAG TPA: antibiotic ABC transporter ATP-binding protein, partial [Candidatus Latescibacteria bacterium]|nr:antibiotic ABC transporter ATP-binding protein [Candidatus Latescibacterota bacterium]